MKSWNDRAKAVFAQGCSTYSKAASQYIDGVYPTHYEDFLGVDFVCGLGSNLIGWENNFSLPSQKEVILAERIKELFPCIDKLKLLKTGSAACSAAVRIARAFSGRSTVFGSGYHGCDNVFISVEKPGAGTVFEDYYKFDNLRDLINGIRNFSGIPAAVIVEPVQLDLGVAKDLSELRRICTEEEIVLIFDEIITGFRTPRYCMANYLGIQPDIICLGKALGNGFPIAIVGGREDIMETPGYFISNTHNGELSAIDAALKTLDYLSKDRLQELWDRGARFLEVFNAINPKIQIKGYPTRGELQGEEMFKALFMQEMCRLGYLFGRAWFLNYSHSRSILQRTLGDARRVCHKIEVGEVKLDGEIPKPIFRRN